MLIIISVIFWIAYAGFIKIVFGMMQREGAFDIISGGKFNKWKDDLYASASVYKKLLELALGGCGKCTALWCSFVWIVIYMAFCWSVHIEWFGGVVANTIWCFVFVFINFLSGYKSIGDGVQ